MTEINFQVNCRKCNKPMKQASKLLQTAIYCRDCGLKATVEFSKTPIVKAVGTTNIQED